MTLWKNIWKKSSGPTGLHKLMLLLLARCFEYSIKTEILGPWGDRASPETVVGLLEDGETHDGIATEAGSRVGRMGQWEHRLVCHRHETPLVLQPVDWFADSHYLKVILRRARSS